jgi:hypothetical protein
MVGSTTTTAAQPVASASRVPGTSAATRDAFDTLLARTISAWARVDLAPLTQDRRDTEAADAGSGVNGRSVRRRPADVNLAADAVQELSSRTDPSPSAGVATAQAVLEHDRSSGGATVDGRSSREGRTVGRDTMPRDDRADIGRHRLGESQRTDVALGVFRTSESRDAEAVGIEGEKRAGTAGRAALNAPAAPSAPSVPEGAPGAASITALGSSREGVGPIPASGGTLAGAPALKGEASTRPTGSRPPAQPQPRSSPYELDHAEFGKQVDRAMTAALRQRGGSVTLRLTPESWGELRVEMSLDKGRVEATFHASSDQARQLLEQHMTALRASLEAHGLAVDRLGVEVMERPVADHGRHADDPWSGPDGGQDAGGAGQREGSEQAASEHAAYGGSTRGTDAPGERSELGEDPAEPVRPRLGDRETESGGAPVVRLRLNTVA